MSVLDSTNNRQFFYTHHLFDGGAILLFQRQLEMVLPDADLYHFKQLVHCRVALPVACAFGKRFTHRDAAADHTALGFLSRQVPSTR